MNNYTTRTLGQKYKLLGALVLVIEASEEGDFKEHLIANHNKMFSGLIDAYTNTKKSFPDEVFKDDRGYADALKHAQPVPVGRLTIEEVMKVCEGISWSDIHSPRRNEVVYISVLKDRLQELVSIKMLEPGNAKPLADIRVDEHGRASAVAIAEGVYPDMINTTKNNGNYQADNIIDKSQLTDEQKTEQFYTDH